MFLNTLVENPVLFFRIVVIVILSVTLHELAHGVAALSQGDDTPQKAGHMTLNPVVHMGWPSMIFLCIAGIAWGQMPINPARFRSPKLSNILVSAAGPLLNLSLGILFIGLINLAFASNLNEIVSIDFLYIAAQINLVLFLFNLIPVPPLDGFHIFSEIFPSFKPLENSYYGLIALMILFRVSHLGVALSAIAKFCIETATGLQSS
jgi:Zn-dependent protease